MKAIKIFLSFFLAALIISGLFLFLRPKDRESSVNAIKPSQLDFTQTNSLPAAENSHTKFDIESKNEVLPQIENLPPPDKAQWTILEDILKTKNDNDPRLDQELKKLSSAFKETLYKKYDLLPPEDHGGRGLIVYLIARNLTNINDIRFLKKIYQDPPCLSMTDCKALPKDGDPHHSAMEQTTLIYEQLSALYLIEKQIEQNHALLNDASSRSEITQVLAQAESYPVRAVHEKARAIRTKYGL